MTSLESNFNSHGEKRFAVLAKPIVDRVPVNIFCCPSKILILPTNSFVGSTKSFVGITKILLGQQKKVYMLNPLVQLSCT